MKSLALSPSSKSAQPTGTLPWVSSGVARGERRWFPFSASPVVASSTETDSFFFALSPAAGGAVDSKVLRSVAAVQRAGVFVQVGGSMCAVSSNMSVKRDCGKSVAGFLHPPRAAAPYLER